MFEDLKFFDCWQTACGLPAFVLDERERPAALQLQQLSLSGRHASTTQNQDIQEDDTPVLQPVTSDVEYMDPALGSFTWITVSQKTLENPPDIPDEEIDPEIAYIEAEEHNEELVLPSGEQGGRYAAFLEVQYDELGVHNILLRMNDGSKHDFFYGCEPWGDYNVQCWSLVGDPIARLKVTYGEGKGLIKRIQITTLKGRKFDTQTGKSQQAGQGDKTEENVQLISEEWELDKQQLGTGYIGSVSAKVDLITMEGKQQENTEDQFYLSDVKFGFINHINLQPIAGKDWESELLENVKPRAKLFAEISPGGKELLTYREGQKFITMWISTCASPSTFLSIPARVNPEVYDLLVHIPSQNMVVAIIGKWWLMWDVSLKNGKRESIIFPMLEMSAKWLRIGKLGCSFSHEKQMLLVGRAAPDMMELSTWQINKGTPLKTSYLVSATVRMLARKPLQIAQTGFFIHGLSVLQANDIAVLWNGFMFLVWNMYNDEKYFVNDIESKTYYKNVSLSYDGTLLGTLAYEDGKSILRVLSLSQNSKPEIILDLVQTKEGEFDPWDCKFHPSERKLASWTTGQGRMIRFIDFDKGTDLVGNLPGQAMQVEWSYVNGVAASICQMDDGCNWFHIWDVHTCTIKMEIKPGLYNMGRMNSCKFSHEGDQLMIWQGELFGSDLPMHELYSKEQLAAMEEERKILEAPKEKDAYTSTTEDALLTMQEESKKKEEKQKQKAVKDAQKELDAKAKANSKAKASTLGHPTKISLAKKFKNGATELQTLNKVANKLVTQSEPPQSLASYNTPRVSEAHAQTEPLPSIKEEDEQEVEPPVQESPIIFPDTTKEVQPDIHYLVESRVLLVRLAPAIPKVPQLQMVDPIDPYRSWWVRCAAITESGQYATYVLTNPDGDGTDMVTVMLDIVRNERMWMHTYKFVDRSNEDIARAVDQFPGAAHMNVKISFSKDGQYIYQVGRYNATFVVKVFDMKGTAILDEVSPSSFQQFDTEHFKPNMSVSYQVILDNCIHASQIVGLTRTQHVVMLSTPGYVSLWGLGDRKFGPIQFRHLYGELLIDAHIVSNEAQVGVITGGWEHLFAWTLTLDRRRLRGTRIVRVEREDFDGYDQDGSDVDIVYGQKESMDVHQVELDTNLIVQYKQVEYVIEDKLLLSNLSQEGDFILLCSKTGQIAVLRFMDMDWYTVWTGYVPDFPKDERVEKIVGGWIETGEQNWVLMVGTMDPKDVVSTAVKFRVIEGQFSTDAELIGSTLRYSELKLNFDGLDQCDGFQRLYTKGLLHRKLLTYQHGKLSVYRRYGRPEGDVWQEEICFDIPPKLQPKVTSCSFSERGDKVICGLRGSRLLILSPGNAVGNLGNLNYHGLLKFSANPNYAIDIPPENPINQPLTLKAVQDTMKMYGIAMITAINTKDPDGRTLLYHAVQDANYDLVKFFLDWAKAQSPRMSLQFEIEAKDENTFTFGYLNAIPKEEVKGATLELFVHALLEYKDEKGWLFSPICIYQVLPRIFRLLAAEHPRLLNWIMQNKNFMPTMAQLNPLSPATIFKKPTPIQEIRLYPQIAPPDYPELLWNKTYLNNKKRKQYYENNNVSGRQMDLAESRVILYRGASENDVRGIVDIFANSANNDDFIEAFDSPPMNVLLELKRQQFGASMIAPEVVVMVMAFLTFTQYALLITSDEPIDDIEHIGDSVESFTAILFGLLMLVAGVFVLFYRYGLGSVRRWSGKAIEQTKREAMQKSTFSIYIRGFLSFISILAAMGLQILFFVLGDRVYVLSATLAILGRQLISDLLHMFSRGLYLWIREGWNIIRAATYILFCVIFAFQMAGWASGTSGQHDTLTALSSVQFILIGATIMGMFRVFKNTGPTIQMIMEVTKEATFYIVILALLIFSFCMAFFTLLYGTGEMQLAQDRDLDTPGHSEFLHALVGTVSMAMGIYDPQDYYASTYWWLAIPLLFLFLLALVIILFNLLISVLGDSFQKSKQLERARFMRARVEIMDELENQLIFHQHKTSSFVHFLAPKTVEKPIQKQAWEGPMNTLIKHVRTIPGQTAQVVKEEIMSEIMEAISSILQQQQEQQDDQQKVAQSTAKKDA